MEASKRSTQRAHGQKLTRRRIPLSCLACRVRKLKCNRENPCQNCIVRGDEAIASCTYAEKPGGRQSSNARSDAADMRSRIGRLEKSILTIMADRNDISSSKSLLERNTSEPMSNDLDTAGGQYYSSDSRSTHWDAILHEIGAMKDAWSEENDQHPVSTETLANPPSSHRLSLLTGLAQPPDRSLILGEIPSKDICLILINRFFDDYTPALPGRFVLHKATFLKQYHTHFADPSKTRIIWIGLLFSVLCLAMHSYIRNNELQDMPAKFRGNPRLAAETFRLHTAECLVLSDITKPKTLLIETLHLHCLAEYCSDDDGSLRGIMILSNTIMRLALQQGYHRDPSQYPNLTIFQREMRRRVWTMVNQGELLWAAQSGIPKHIKYAECDVAPASNIFEEELFEEMETMPPSRPLTVHTEITYLVVKAKTMRGFGQVIEFQHTIEGKPYSEVMRLDMMLNKIKEEVPPNFQLRSLEAMRGDPESLIVERFVIDQYYHKAICILHRKYWSQSIAIINSSPLFYSRKVSATSSMALLENQATMHGGSKSCGPLKKMKWHHFSMSTHDFLLAAMIVSLDLSCEQIPQSEGSLQPSQKIQALERSRAIWVEVINECSDAKRAVHTLDSVLTKLKSKPEYSALFVSAYGHGQCPQTLQLPETGSVQASNLCDVRPAVFPFLESIKLPPPTQSVPLNETMTFDDNNSAFLGVDTNMPLDFDWDAWDQFVNDDMFSAPTQ